GGGGGEWRGRGPADARRLDAQRARIGGLAGVAPKPAGVVAHLRLGQELLGQGEGAAGVPRQERILGIARAGAEMARHRASICRGRLGPWSSSRAPTRAVPPTRSARRSSGPSRPRRLPRPAPAIERSTCWTRWPAGAGTSADSWASSSPRSGRRKARPQLQGYG